MVVLQRARSWLVFHFCVLCLADVGYATCLSIFDGSDSAQIISGNEHKLVGLIVGGRATGSWLPKEIKALGFKVVHIYQDSLDAGIVTSFKPEDYDFPAIVYNEAEGLDRVIKDITALALREKLQIAGFVPGMDYGVVPQSILSDAFKLPGNSVELAATRSDKAKLNTFLRGLGVPTVNGAAVAYAQATTLAMTMQFPLYIKPVISWGSVGAGPSQSLAELPADLERLRADVAKIKLPFDEVFLLDHLHGDTIWFADSISVWHREKVKRIVTGMWVDHRGDDFPKEVWDFIEMLPPPGHASADEAELFNRMLIANERTLAAAEIKVGAAHLEFMARGPVITSADDLLPTDLNLRGPGLRTWSLEQRATGVNPYRGEILSRVAPALLADDELIYSEWRERVALVFIRSYGPGRVTAEGLAWINSLRTPQLEFDGAYVVDDIMPAAGAPTVRTDNGATMVGTLHVAGPTRESLLKLYKEIRVRERRGFFSKG